jgi:hypothetical protein
VNVTDTPVFSGAARASWLPAGILDPLRTLGGQRDGAGARLQRVHSWQSSDAAPTTSVILASPKLKSAPMSNAIVRTDYGAVVVLAELRTAAAR